MVHSADSVRLKNANYLHSQFGSLKNILESKIFLFVCRLLAVTAIVHSLKISFFHMLCYMCKSIKRSKFSEIVRDS